MVRTVLRFCAALRYPECSVLAAELALGQFECGGGARGENKLCAGDRVHPLSVGDGPIRRDPPKRSRKRASDLQEA
jgi:hypothetical protein